MLVTSIHEHAGLGNQIWRYVCCRVFAERMGYDWGVSHPGWRGKFLNVDWGKDVPFNVEEDSDFKPDQGFTYYKEESIHHASAPGEIGAPDLNFLKIGDNTYINGTFQKMSYISESRDKILKWLTYDDKYKIDKSIMNQLIARFVKLTGFKKKKIIFKKIHGWKYSYNYKKTPYLSLWNKKYNLGVCGDWFSGPKVENAWLSANDLARKIK